MCALQGWQGTRFEANTDAVRPTEPGHDNRCAGTNGSVCGPPTLLVDGRGAAAQRDEGAGCRHVAMEGSEVEGRAPCVPAVGGGGRK